MKIRQVIGLFAVVAAMAWCAAASAQESDDEQAPAEQAGAPGDGSRASGSEAQADVRVESLTLAELIAQAVTNGDLVAEFEARRAKAEWDQYRADYAWMPKLSANTTVAPVPANAEPDRFEENVDEFIELDIGPFVRQDFDVIVPIYTFGRVSTAQELAELGVDNAELKNEKARLEVIFQTKRAYYSLRLARAFEGMLEEGNELIKERLDEMQDAREFGEADFDIKDYRKLQIFSAEIDSRVVDNARLATVAQAGLRFLADLDRQTEVAVPELDDLESPPELRDRAYYLSAALRHRPELAQLDKAVEARRLEHQLEKANWYPNLFAAFSLGVAWSTEKTALQEVCREDPSGDCVEVEDLFAEPYGDPLNGFSVRVGLGLRWKVDPFQQYASVQKKDAQRHQITAQRQRARRAVELEVTKLYQEAADARTKLDINRRRLNAAERWRNQFGLSRQTIGGELDDAVAPLKAFYEARAKYLEAVYNYLIARAELAQAVGAAGLGEDGAVGVD